MSGASLKKGLAWVINSTHHRVGMFFIAGHAILSNTMLKHLGGCRVAGGEQPPKSEGGLGANARERGGSKGWDEFT